MSTGSRLHTLLPAAALVVAVALALAAIGETLFVATASPLLRGVLLGAGLTIAGTMAVVLWRRLSQRQRNIQRQCLVLCQLEPHQLTDDASGVLPNLEANHPWRATFDQMREALARYASHAQDAELARATTEIRAQRHAQRAERLEQILAGLPEPVLAIDEFDDVVLSNPSAAELFHLDHSPDASAERRVLAEVVECQKLVELLHETRRRKLPTTRTCELELHDEGGQSHWYNATARGYSIGASENSPHGAVAVLRDIDGLKALQRRNAEFVSAVSHEMKAPLAGIKAYVELLADNEAEDEATREEFLQVINSQADRLHRLVDNMLNLARIEAGVVAVNKQQLSLNDLLIEALNVVQPSAERKQISLVSDLSQLYLAVVADRDMILQAAINLLSNAVKYTPDGGTVTLRSRLIDHHVQFDVTDTGVGLAPEDCHKVFEKFYRVKKDQQMASGTGLGLPLAKHIIEDVHAGALTVESELGVGSTFRVTLSRAANQPKSSSQDASHHGAMMSEVPKSRA